MPPPRRDWAWAHEPQLDWAVAELSPAQRLALQEQPLAVVPRAETRNATHRTNA
jgi:hypothetical protein